MANFFKDPFGAISDGFTDVFGGGGSPLSDALVSATKQLRQQDSANSSQAPDKNASTVQGAMADQRRGRGLLANVLTGGQGVLDTPNLRQTLLGGF